MRRAVVIGAQTLGLRGVHADVELMCRLLGARGFTSIRACVEEDATYHGIVEALDRLRSETEPGDTVVVYYSGHGALVDDLQFLVPVDIAQTTRTDFRGYLAHELTAVTRELAAVTRNITCILDCCHSGGMLRDPEPWRLKSRSLPWLATDAGRERADRHPADVLVPHVVRLLASQKYGSAYEADNHQGTGSQGLFTATLADVLDAGRAHPVPWSVVMARVRDRLKQRVPQWPDAGGPAGRLPFSLEAPALPERLPLTTRGGRLVIPGAAVFGIATGDVVRVPLPDGNAPECAVEQVVAGDAVLSAAPEALFGTAQPPPGTHAVPILVHDRRHVYLGAFPEGPFAAALRARVEASPRLAETDDAAYAFASVRMRSDGRVGLVDGEGLAFRHPVEPSEDGVADLAALLETLAHGDRVRQLTDQTGDTRPTGDVDVRFELLTPGAAPSVLRPTGERLFDRDRYRVAVANRSARRLYLWLLGVGVSGRTDLVSFDQPSGIALNPAGEPDDRQLIGPVEIYWPEDVPPVGRRPETVHLVVGDRPLDLSPLAAPGVARGTALPALLRQAWDGRRDQRHVAEEEFLHRLHSVHVLVEPRRREAAP